MAYKLTWISSDGQSSLDMGSFNTMEELKAAVPNAREELIRQCGDADQLKAIEAGRLEVELVSD